jgi:hypothetical protein
VNRYSAQAGACKIGASGFRVGEKGWFSTCCINQICFESVRPELVEGLVLISVHPSTSSGRTERKQSNETGDGQYNPLETRMDLKIRDLGCIAISLIFILGLKPS